MGVGPIIWTCLALTVHQGPVREFFISDRAFKIPIRPDPKKIGEVRALILLVSVDKGKTWEQADRKAPNEREFIYRATNDGSYWFIVQQEDRTGRASPDNPERVKPNMAVVVDATRPQIKVSAERLPSGEILARWKAVDSYPELHSLRLDYHSGAHPESGWTTVGLPTTLEGEQKFLCKDASGEVRVRVRMKDQAGNEGGDIFVLPAAAASAAVAPPEGPAIGLIPTTPSNPSSQPNRLTSQQTPRPLIEAAPGTLSPPSPPPGEMSGGLPIAASQGGQTSSSQGGQPPRLPLAGTAETPVPPPSSFTETAANSAVKIVRSREVRIDFTVGKVGPSGLGSADVYVTLDQGRSWQKMPGEVPISLPPNTDLHGPEVSGSVSLQLPKDGIIYGFIVAVKSKAGLAPVAPKPGDPPQALVEWDKTAPAGQLFKPQPDPSQPNTLVLAWEVKDRNLAEKPITLEWAERTDGPWTPLSEASLPNSGQYPWHLPDHLPPRVYFRMTMRDQAGNESRAQTDKPILIDLSVPQTRITGIAPASR